MCSGRIDGSPCSPGRLEREAERCSCRRLALARRQQEHGHDPDPRMSHRDGLRGETRSLRQRARPGRMITEPRIGPPDAIDRRDVARPAFGTSRILGSGDEQGHVPGGRRGSGSGGRRPAARKDGGEDRGAPRSRHRRAGRRAPFGDPRAAAIDARPGNSRSRHRRRPSAAGRAQGLRPPKEPPTSPAASWTRAARSGRAVTSSPILSEPDLSRWASNGAPVAGPRTSDGRDGLL
jgi:hypothetical protein